MTENPASTFGQPPADLTDDVIDEYAAEIRELPRYESTSRFAPASPTDRTDPDNAYVTPFTAESADTGPLHTLEIAVKDNIAVRGIPITLGTDTIAFDPGFDATVVKRLRHSGATITGTTNMDALALGTTGEFSSHGRTENPTADGCVPGGSSSGSGAAVAGGLVDAALGTDTGGSVRIPASFCGIVGFKPTSGLISWHGVAPLAPSLDHVGTLANDVVTATKVVEEIAGADPANPTTARTPDVHQVDITSELETPPQKIRIGVIEESMAVAADGVQSAIRQRVSTVGQTHDYAVETVSVPDFDVAVEVNDVQTIMEFSGLLSSTGQLLGSSSWDNASWSEAVRTLCKQGVPVHDRIRRLIHLGHGLLREYGPSLYARAWEARRQFSKQVATMFERVDVLVTPTTPMVPPAFGEILESIDIADTLRNTAPFNNTGHPCVSVPCTSVDGQPVGLQIVTPAGTDGFTARVASVFEQDINTKEHTSK